MVKTCSDHEIEMEATRAKKIRVPEDAYRDCYVKGGNPKLIVNDKGTTFECVGKQDPVKEGETK